MKACGAETLVHPDPDSPIEEEKEEQTTRTDESETKGKPFGQWVYRLEEKLSLFAYWLSSTATTHSLVFVYYSLTHNGSQ